MKRINRMHKKTHKTKRMKKTEALLQEYQTLFVTLPRNKPRGGGDNGCPPRDGASNGTWVPP